MKIRTNIASSLLPGGFFGGIYRLNAAFFKPDSRFVIFYVTCAAFFTLQGFHFFDAFTRLFNVFPL